MQPSDAFTFTRGVPAVSMKSWISARLTVALLLAGLFTGLLVGLLVGCGDSAYVATSLSVLNRAQRDFNGRKVTVSGTLRTFDKPRHYWIENDSFDRVALEGNHDFALWVGRTVEVRGTFLYDVARGRRIEVEGLSRSPL